MYMQPGDRQALMTSEYKIGYRTLAPRLHMAVSIFTKMLEQ